MTTHFIVPCPTIGLHLQEYHVALVQAPEHIYLGIHMWSRIHYVQSSNKKNMRTEV